MTQPAAPDQNEQTEQLSTDAGAPSAPQADPDPMPAFDPKHPLYDKYHPKHREAVAELMKKRYAEDAPPAIDDPDRPAIYELREAAGVSQPFLTPEYAARWDENAEGDVLSWASREYVAPATMQSAIDWYVQQEFTREGGVTGAGAEDDFRASFEGKFTPAQINKLVAWSREYHGAPAGASVAESPAADGVEPDGVAAGYRARTARPSAPAPSSPRSFTHVGEALHRGRGGAASSSPVVSADNPVPSDPQHPYWVKDAPGHKEAVRQVAAAFARRHRDAGEDRA